MPLVLLETVKAHVRVDHSDDDVLLEAYRDAAEAAAIGHLCRVVHPTGTVLPAEGEEGYDATAIVVGPAIVAAVLLLTGDLYESREAGGTGDAVLPASVRALLAPWRIWQTFDDDEVADADV